MPVPVSGLKAHSHGMIATATKPYVNTPIDIHETYSEMKLLSPHINPYYRKQSKLLLSSITVPVVGATCELAFKPMTIKNHTQTNAHVTSGILFTLDHDKKGISISFINN